MFDLASYGDGLGLVMLGFIVGLVIGYIFKVIGKIGYLSILFALLFVGNSYAENIPVIAMTSNNTPAPYVASAYTTYPGYFPFRAFDGTSSMWCANGLTYTYIQIDFGSPYIVNSYTLKTWHNAYWTNAWYIEASKDGITWFTIDNKSNQTLTTSGVTFGISNTIAYRFYRLVPTSTYADSNYCFAEIIYNGYTGIVQDTDKFSSYITGALTAIAFVIAFATARFL